MSFVEGAATQTEVERRAEYSSPNRSLDRESPDLEDDISVGDNRSDTSTPNDNEANARARKANIRDEETEPSSPNEYNRIPNSNYGSPFKEDGNDDEAEPPRVKLYDSGLFHLYRPEGKSDKDDATDVSSPFGHVSESIYGRSMDLTKGTFPSQLFAGFAASVIAGNSQRDGQDSPGNSLLVLTICPSSKTHLRQAT